MDKEVMESNLAKFLETDDIMVDQSKKDSANPNVLRKVFDLLDEPDSDSLRDIKNTCLPR